MNFKKIINLFNYYVYDIILNAGGDMPKQTSLVYLFYLY